MSAALLESTIVFPTESMRGPGLKSTLDVRRLWRCPTCGYERHVGQTTTSVLCFCKDPPVQMKLIEGKRVVRPEPRPVARFIDESELPPDDTPAGQAPPPPAVKSVEITAVEIVVETVVETAAAPPPVPSPSDTPSAKKRRRRSKGRREPTPGEPQQTAPPTSEPPNLDTPAPSSEKSDFGEGLPP